MTHYFEFLRPWKKGLGSLKNNNRVLPTPENARVEEDFNLIDKISFLNSFMHLKIFCCTASCNHIVCIQSDCHTITELGTYFKSSRSARNVLDMDFIIVFLARVCNHLLDACTFRQKRKLMEIKFDISNINYYVSCQLSCHIPEKNILEHISFK
ncbi:hypothetical protein V8G54_005170 [Vigna mungo]|uniref:Uncharacterized protein n=1 Tax=Vigna mungo TaxID=3915 RepID=A0AAQ3SGE1_VIGMU